MKPGEIYKMGIFGEWGRSVELVPLSQLAEEAAQAEAASNDVLVELHRIGTEVSKARKIASDIRSTMRKRSAHDRER